MEALIVPPPHPFQCRQLDLFDSPPGAASTDQFGLVEPVDGLSERTVATIADGPGRGRGAEFDDPIRVDERQCVSAVISSRPSSRITTSR